MSKTSIRERNKAIRLAWEREQGLVLEGKGTRDWTEVQQKDILNPDKGKAYDENGRAFEGQHMKSAAEYPEYQGDPDNIQFLTRDEHQEAHKGNWQNATNWYYNPETKEFVDFGENKPTPCAIIKLSNPIAFQKASSIIEHDEVESSKEQKIASESSDKPDSILTINETIDISPSHNPNIKPHLSGTQGRNRIGKAINAIKTVVVKAAKWTWNHKGTIIAGVVVTFGKLGLDIADAVSNSNSRTSGNEGYQSASNTSRRFSDREESLSSHDDVIPGGQDESEKGTHASPHKHMVKPHGQRYGKDKVWKEKEAYSRGGKNKNKE